MEHVISGGDKMIKRMIPELHVNIGAMEHSA
jgi:hypothetical protein